MDTWGNIAFNDIPQEERLNILNDLLQHCKLDSLAMVEIWRYLKKNIN